MDKIISLSPTINTMFSLCPSLPLTPIQVSAEILGTLLPSWTGKMADPKELLGFLDLSDLSPLRVPSLIDELASIVGWEGKPAEKEWALLHQLEKISPEHMTIPLRTWFSFLDEFEGLNQRISSDLRSINEEQSFNKAEALAGHAASLAALLDHCEQCPYPQTAFASLQKIAEKLKLIRSAHSIFVTGLLESAKQKWQNARGRIDAASTEMEKREAQKMGKALQAEQRETIEAFESVHTKLPVQAMGASTWWELIQSRIEPFIESFTSAWQTAQPDLKTFVEEEKEEARETLASIARDCQAAVLGMDEVCHSEPLQWGANECDPSVEIDLLRNAMQAQREEAKRLSIQEKLASQFERIESLIEEKDLAGALANLQRICWKTWEESPDHPDALRLNEMLAVSYADHRQFSFGTHLRKPFWKRDGIGRVLPKRDAGLYRRVDRSPREKVAERYKRGKGRNLRKNWERRSQISGKKIVKERMIFEKMSRQFKKAEEIAKVFDGSDFSQFAQKFLQEANALKPRESFFFHGGWQNIPAGHSVVYEVIKEEGDRFAFRVYNRGEGMEYHEHAQIQGKGYSFPFKEIIHIPFENLANESHLKSSLRITAHASCKPKVGSSPPLSDDPSRSWRPDQLPQLYLRPIPGRSHGRELLLFVLDRLDQSRDAVAATLPPMGIRTPAQDLVEILPARNRELLPLPLTFPKKFGTIGTKRQGVIPERRHIIYGMVLCQR